jgi:dCTP deaminase
MSPLKVSPLAVLSDSDISKRLADRTLAIEPFDEAHVTPNGYDLSLGEIQQSGKDVVRDGKVSIPPGGWFAVSTRERVRFPADLCGELWLRSSHIRKGIITSFGRVDAGFEGHLTLTGFNAGATPVELCVGDRYCQLVVVELSSPAAKPYAARSGHYQGQAGITLDAFGSKKGGSKVAKAPRKGTP